jgi:peptidoglycan/xylan/chitin deacetylase (PgdA/CDA1 family)
MPVTQTHTSKVNILMYHSISEGTEPTCIPPSTFRQQLTALADLGYHAVSLADCAAWIRGTGQLPERPVVITFDDGYDDFAEMAFPEIAARGWTATVFLPARKIGGVDDWNMDAGRSSARRLMTWKTAAALARMGITFGGHGLNHTELTLLSRQAMCEEIVQCKRLIEDHTGYPVTSFAAPYGRTNRAVRAEIRQHYLEAVGTDLARAQPTSDVYNLPRIEMWYFRDEGRWRAYLQGRSKGYFVLRQALRKIRTTAAAGFMGPGLMAPPQATSSR